MSEARRPRRRFDRQLGRYGSRRPGCGPICASRGSTGRSAPGCCCCRAGGRPASPRSRPASPIPIPGMCLLFFIGAFAMRGAGCTWNDIVDRDLDAMVERTRSRPIPSGQVTVDRQLAFLVLQALVGLAVLLQFNRFTIADRHRLAGDGRDLSVPQARHVLAADRAGPRLFLGRADGLAGGFGRLDAAGASFSMPGRLPG